MGWTTRVIFGYQLGQDVYSVHSIQTSFGLYLASCSMEAVLFIWHKVSDLKLITCLPIGQYCMELHIYCPIHNGIELNEGHGCLYLYLCLPEILDWVPLVRLVWIIPFCVAWEEYIFQDCVDIKMWKAESMKWHWRQSLCSLNVHIAHVLTCMWIGLYRCTELSHVLFIYGVATALALISNTPRSHLPLKIYLNL